MSLASQPSSVACRQGIPVVAVARGSPSWHAGIRPGDRLLSVDGEPLRDELDFSFLAARPEFSLGVTRRGRGRLVRVVRRHGEFAGVELRPPPVQRCANRCVFCFVDQMPRGLRSSLYVKDEDVRHSFLNGNFVTLASARRADLDRIIRLGLSPLYVSVHAADPAVRGTMLGNPRAPDIREQLRYLVRAGITLHTQIVVCPGYNDGAVLRRTVGDLLRLGTNVASIAVVPVGLTRFRRVPLKPVDAAGARAICRDVARLGDADARRCGRRRIFAADELYIRAGLPLPPRRWYGAYPQIGNGVGLVRRFLDQWASLRRRASLRSLPRPRRARRCLVITSVSAFPFVRAVARAMAGPGVEVAAVRNRFFGETVTVAGLLTARDVVASVRTSGREWRRVVLPAAMFNYRGVTLDGYTRGRIARTLGMPVASAGTVVDLAGVLGVL